MGIIQTLRDKIANRGFRLISDQRGERLTYQWLDGYHWLVIPPLTLIVTLPAAWWLWDKPAVIVGGLVALNVIVCYVVGRRCCNSTQLTRTPDGWRHGPRPHPPAGAAASDQYPNPRTGTGATGRSP